MAKIRELLENACLINCLDNFVMKSKLPREVQWFSGMCGSTNLELQAISWLTAVASY